MERQSSTRDMEMKSGAVSHDGIGGRWSGGVSLEKLDVDGSELNQRKNYRHESRFWGE